MSRFDEIRKSLGQRLRTRKARRGRAKLTPLSRVLAALSGVLALAAVILLVNYLLSWNRTNKEQQEQRSLYTQGQSQAGQATAVPNEEPAAENQESVQANAETASETQPPVLTPSPFSEERASMSDRFLPLMRRNQDVVGWLHYPLFSEMDFAVVQRDNEFYMDRAFSGEKNIAGTVFLDEVNAIRPRDTNLILHGHNMKNGTMFGRLSRLMEPGVIKASPFISFDTLYQDALYVPYAVTVFSVNPQNERFHDIIAPNFASVDEMGEYVNWLRARSVLRFPVEVSASDRLLTLVTCHGLDEDESPDILKEAIIKDLVKN